MCWALNHQNIIEIAQGQISLSERPKVGVSYAYSFSVELELLSSGVISAELFPLFL
jgi:hypothetical protein